MRALIFGCGYLGRRVGAIWRSTGVQVTALTRSHENAIVLAQQGIDPVVGDVLLPQTLQNLPAADIGLYAVGYDSRSAASKHDVYVRGVTNVLEQIGLRVRRLLYVSSTSVYGQDAGEWTDETSETCPQTEDGRIVLAAEEAVRNACSGTVTVLRLSGIYGPGRLLRRAESVRNGEPIAANPDGFLNLIHVDDAAQIVAHLARRASDQSSYLVTDDQPVRRREYYGLLAQLVGAGEPVFHFDGKGAGLNKRCSNARLKAEPGITLLFPTIATGLPHALNAQKD
jgi:nucleoside-diphosphate-sugar epimerase